MSGDQERQGQAVVFVAVFLTNEEATVPPDGAEEWWEQFGRIKECMENCTLRSFSQNLPLVS